MGLSNQQIMNTFVLMATGYQYGLVNQWMEGYVTVDSNARNPAL